MQCATQDRFESQPTSSQLTSGEIVAASVAKSTFAGANYQVDSPAGRLAGSAELATFKKYGYPAVLTPIILYSRKTCSVDLDSKT